MTSDGLLVVTPTYGHLEYAEAAVRSVFANTVQLKPHVLIIDDASPNWDEGWATRLTAEFTGRLCVSRWSDNRGLTAAWNFGLSRAIVNYDLYPYAVVTNSDVLFTPGWDVAIRQALDDGWHLVGPVTNTPGDVNEQYVARYATVYENSDASDVLQRIAADLRQRPQVLESKLNGFCLAAKTATWLQFAYDRDQRIVFRPRNDYNSKGQVNSQPLMTLNEHEMQARWRQAGLKIGIASGSYVYHYRSVSRGKRFLKGDWARRKASPA